MLMKNAPSGQLDVESLKKLGMNLLIVSASAALTYAAEWASSADFGQYKVFVVPILAGGIDAARRWLKDYSSK